MASVLSDPEKAALIKQKQDPDSTIDNSATYTQLAFLARVYSVRKLDRHKEAFLRGVDYLLKAQYESGGWPQYYPLRKGYYTHITFNDEAMIGVMELLRDISGKKAEYTFVDAERRARAQKAMQKGIELILKTQVVVDGKRTVWGQQYDESTLAPAWARKFEPPCLTAGESVGIVRFLMQIDRPSQQVVDAVESATAWFKKSELKGIKWTEEPDKSVPGGFNRVVVKDPTAGPLWARFYEIGTNRPIFLGRDSVIRYDVSQIEAERRNGYAWYVASPAKLLDHDYAAWRQKHTAARSRRTGHLE
jgi:PelA/Pel-15E family pectate lyase